MPDEDIPVLIVGDSLVGLSSSLFLAWHGIQSLVIERHPGTAIHPRAGVFNQRTLEIYRTVGLEGEIVRRASEEFVQDGAIIAVDKLAGKELAYFLPSLNEGVRDVSPSERLYCTQSVLEPILLKHAKKLGAQMQFNAEVISFECIDDGIRAVIKDNDSGKERVIRSRYMIGADGNRSPVREQLGIAMHGHGTFANSATIYFRADIRPILGDRPWSIIYVTNDKLKGFMRLFESGGLSGFLAVNAVMGPEGKVDDVAEEATDEQRCVEMVRDAIGVPDLDVEIVVVQPWKATADVADHFHEGPIFLAGDAAHVMPPTGGFGGNTGVADAHNIAWKLALVLKGLAGPELLSTYEPERRPAGMLAVEQAYTRYVLRMDPSLGDHDIQEEIDDLRIELGYCYNSTAIYKDGYDVAEVHEHPRESKANPGTRAPHLFLEHNGKQISSLDLFAKNFVILTVPDGKEWCQAARNVAEDFNIEIDTYCVGGNSGLTVSG